MAQAKNLQNLITRALAGTVFVLLVVASLLFGPWTLAILFVFFTMAGLHECYDLLSKHPSVHPRLSAGFLTGLCTYFLMVAVAMNVCSFKWFIVLIPLIVIVFCIELYSRDKFSLTHLGATAIGWIYVVVPFGLIHAVAMAPGTYNYHLPLGYFILLWTNDTGAYISGRWLGKHKLYEKVSPNKTWEGLFGGIALAFAVAWILSLYFMDLNLSQWWVVAAIISVFGNLGDLFESLVKRGAGVKDSGKIIPGHGGVLDRFDGYLLSIPMVYMYIELFVFS